MAQIHPTVHRPLLSAGAYRELDVLQALEQGLPAGWDLFHNIDWATFHEGRQHIGEVDIAAVSPGGFLLLIEVKAGAVDEHGGELTKHYGSTHDAPKSIGDQLRRNHAALLCRLRDAGLQKVRLGTLLALPDHKLHTQVLAHPSHTIVDAAAWDDLCPRIQQLAASAPVDDGLRGRLVEFLSGRFNVTPDVSVQIGQLQRASASLAAGLATWVPCIEHPSGMYRIQATAGSGKTQLALGLLRKAHAAGRRGAYICFNRPLADHMAHIAPPTCTVSTFHELARDHGRTAGEEPDFADPGVHERLAQKLVDDAPDMPSRWDLLVIDEHQDFEPAWAQAVVSLVNPDASVYVMGDESQQLYARTGFDLPDAVTIRCQENFRSPRKVVDAINMLQLCPEPVVARSPYAGEVPGFHTYTRGPHASVRGTEACVRKLLEEGIQPGQITVLSFSGIQRSELLRQDRLAGLGVRRFLGQYDKAGNALFTQGELQVETVYRFKGQSAPVVVFSEIEFAELGEKELRKLFVGFTRAQYRLECVLSEPAAQELMQRAG